MNNGSPMIEDDDNKSQAGRRTAVKAVVNQQLSDEETIKRKSEHIEIDDIDNFECLSNEDVIMHHK